VDAWLRDFVRTTAGFAVWNAPHSVTIVEVTLQRDADGRLRCELLDIAEGGACFPADGSSREIFEAIQIAADRLEVELADLSTVATAREHRTRVAA